MAEKIVGLVRRVTLSEMGFHKYDLLFTDKRIILLRAGGAEPDLSLFTKDYLRHSFQPINPYASLVNSVIRQDPTEFDKRMAAYRKRDLDELAQSGKSISYSLMKTVELRNGFNGSLMLIRHSSPSGENEMLKIRLDPRIDMSMRVRFPHEAMEAVNTDGDYANLSKENRDEICRQIDAAKEEYYRSVRSLLLSCLPNNLKLSSKGLL